jgi:hypothetical protein
VHHGEPLKRAVDCRAIADKLTRLERQIDLETPQSNTQTVIAPVCVVPFGEDYAILHWIVRLRWVCFALIGILLVAGYNGQWRVGRDSSLYRAVGRNLADGKGYTFRGERASEAYPGLPRLLWAVEKVAGREDALHPRLSLALMTLMAAGTLVTIYHLIKLHFPAWMAVCVTTGVGISVEFQEYAHDLMTDLPFLLGVCLLLLGIGRLRAHRAWRPRIVDLAGLVLPGAVLAMTMRPTFWALAGALAAAAVVGMIRSPRRASYGIGLLLLLGLVAGWLMLDPRGGGHPFGGKQETAIFRHLAALGGSQWREAFQRTIGEHLPQAMFGLTLMLPLGALVLIELIVAAVWLMRWSVLWGMYVLVTLAMMLFIGSVPRYFLMVLPLLLVEWAMLTWWVSQRIARWLWVREALMLLGLAAATALPLGRSLLFVLEQHGVGFVAKGQPESKQLVRGQFLEIYRGGKMLPLIELARSIQQRVPAGSKVLGPEPRILSFLSGRDVWQPSEPPVTLKRLAGGRFASWTGAERRRQYRLLLARRGFTHIVYGPRFAAEKMIARLIRGRFVIVAPKSVVELNGMKLGQMRLPPADQRAHPKPPASRPARRARPT